MKRYLMKLIDEEITKNLHSVEQETPKKQGSENMHG